MKAIDPVIGATLMLAIFVLNAPTANAQYIEVVSGTDYDCKELEETLDLQERSCYAMAELEAEAGYRKRLDSEGLHEDHRWHEYRNSKRWLTAKQILGACKRQTEAKAEFIKQCENFLPICPDYLPPPRPLVPGLPNGDAWPAPRIPWPAGIIWEYPILMFEKGVAGGTLPTSYPPGETKMVCVPAPGPEWIPGKIRNWEEHEERFRDALRKPIPYMPDLSTMP